MKDIVDATKEKSKRPISFEKYEDSSDFFSEEDDLSLSHWLVKKTKKKKKNQPSRKQRVRNSKKAHPERHAFMEKRRTMLMETEALTEKAKDIAERYNLGFDAAYQVVSVDMPKQGADNEAALEAFIIDLDNKDDGFYIKEKVEREARHYVDDDNNSQFTVKCVKGVRKNKNNEIEYLVQWGGKYK
jgi:hypothetical protein